MDLPQPSLRDPAKLFYQTDKTRRSIVLAYWSIVILTVPLWWYTTSIERLSLPSRHVHQQAENHLQLPVRICLQTVDEHLSGSVRTSFADNISFERQRWRGLAVDVFGKANCGMPFIYASYILRANEIIKAAEETPKDKFYTIIFKDGPISIQNRSLYFPPNCESNICAGYARSSQAQHHRRNWLIPCALSLCHTPAYPIETIVLPSTLPIIA
jgi:phosphatidylinositol glycan class S